MVVSWVLELLILFLYIVKVWKYRCKKVRNEKLMGWEMKFNYLKFDIYNNCLEFV